MKTPVAGLKWGLFTIATIIALSTAVTADLIWWDGTREAGDTPPGKLLSDNIGYYGECVLTGVEYTCDSSSQPQENTRKNKPKLIGRQLLDGEAGRGENGLVSNGPITAVFDFKRNCSFAEVDISSVASKMGIKIEAADSPNNWRKIFDRSLNDSPSAALHRVKLSDKPTGRYLRITLIGGGETQVDEVHVWGDAEVSQDNPEAINPIAHTLKVQNFCSFSIPGIDRTGVVYSEHQDWLKKIGRLSKKPAVWSQVSTWDSISHTAILPPMSAVNMPVNLTMARNETESAALALTNTLYPDVQNLEIKLSEFKNVTTGNVATNMSGKLYVAGAIQSSIFGVVLGPLFEQGNMPGLSLMKRYVANTEYICNFPKIKIPRMSSAVFWLSVTTDGVEPGIYEATLSYNDDPGIKISAEVLNVTLPDIFTYNQSYSRDTTMFPFVYDDRLEREVAYRESIGLNTYSGLPEPGSMQDLARKRSKNVIFQTYGLPFKYRQHFDATKLTAGERKEIEDCILTTVKHTQELGLDYKDWVFQLWDEPGTQSCRKYEMVSEVVHRADPKVQLYCNPTTTDVGGDWYNKHIAVSYPYANAVLKSTEGDQFFNAPRRVNGFYKIASSSSRGERSSYIELYRDEAWIALSRGWNGWGFFAYYRPTLDPWTDFDSKSTEATTPDYSLVFPGPRGPVPTRPSEAVREGYEDFRLMTLLREKNEAEFDSIIGDYKKGVTFTELRLRALKAAAKVMKK